MRRDAQRSEPTRREHGWAHRAACLCLPIIMATATAAARQTASIEALADANQRLAQHDAVGAERILTTAIASLPAADATRPTLLYQLGYVLEREDKASESLAVFTRAAALRPPAAGELRWVALDYVLLNDQADAIHWLKRSIEMDPANADAWYDLGRAEMTTHDFIAAELALQRASALAPNDAKVENNLGVVYEAKNRSAEALAMYSRAIHDQADKPHPSEQPLLNAGSLLVSSNRAAEAVSPLEQAVAIAPGDAKCHEALARAYTQVKRLDDADREMKTAISLDAENPQLHFELGRIEREEGLAAQAAAEFKTAQTLYRDRARPAQPATAAHP